MSPSTLPTPVTLLVAAYLGGVGLLVAFLLMLTPTFHDGSPDYPVWEVVNWFMLIAMPLLLWVNWTRKSSMGGSGTDPATREYVAANVALYATLGLIIIFFWQFLFQRFPESETGHALNSHIIHFPLMDVAFALLTGQAAHHLWRGSQTEPGGDNDAG